MNASILLRERITASSLFNVPRARRKCDRHFGSEKIIPLKVSLPLWRYAKNCFASHFVNKRVIQVIERGKQFEVSFGRRPDEEALGQAGRVGQAMCQTLPLNLLNKINKRVGTGDG